MDSIRSTLVSCGPAVLSILSLRNLVLVFAIANMKSLHFMWSVRFLHAFTRRLTDSAPNKHLSPRCLFLPAISATRSGALECDYNLHKSNSTYFTDMDMSRGNFSLVLFSKLFNPFPGPSHFTMILSGTACTWRKEIKPYQPYELWTRLLSWDEKWVYVVTHFVKADVFHPEEYVMKPTYRKTKATGKEKDDVDSTKAVFASSVARYVFKSNRRTVPPEQVLRECGLLPEDEAGLVEAERVRAKALPLGRLESGWDAVHGCFEPGPSALGRYSSVW
ncbi:hypothetical protein BR93DRAFT_948605 [Coniochaeta sp. PMI_546]|nr:hypothetical protein BR93DRAFT_948605 [Coniochaeta sp. PMI_546]